MTTTATNPYLEVGAEPVRRQTDNPYLAVGAEPVARPEPGGWYDETPSSPAAFVDDVPIPETDQAGKIEPWQPTPEQRLRGRIVEAESGIGGHVADIAANRADRPGLARRFGQSALATLESGLNLPRQYREASDIGRAVGLEVESMKRAGRLPPDTPTGIAQAVAVRRLGIDPYEAGRQGVATGFTELLPDDPIRRQVEMLAMRAGPADLEAVALAREATESQLGAPLPPPEANTITEKAADIGGSLAGFIPQVMITKRLPIVRGLGPAAGEAAAFGGVEMMHGGDPLDIVQAGILGGGLGKAGQLTKGAVPASMAAGGGITYAQTGDPEAAATMALLPATKAIGRVPEMARRAIAKRAMETAQRQMITNRPLAMEAGARTLPTGEGASMWPMPEADAGPFVPLGMRSPTPIRPRIGTDLPPGARAAELRQRLAEVEEMGLVPRGPIQEPGTAELAELQRMGLVPTAPGEAPPPFMPEAPAAKPKGRRGKGKPAPEKPKAPAMPAFEAPRVRQPPPEPQRTVKQRQAGLEALHQIRQGKSLRDIGYPTEEISDATRIRADEGPVLEGRAVPQRGQGEGRPDLERGAPGQPGRPEAQASEAEVGVSPVKLAEVTGHVPERSPEAVGAVAGGEGMPDVVGKLNPWGEAAKTKRGEVERTRTILKEREGAIALHGSKAPRLKKELRKLRKGGHVQSAEDYYALWEGMTGNRPVETLDPPAQEWIRNARKFQDPVSKELIRELLYISGGKETPMIRSVRKNMGLYVHEQLRPEGPIQKARALATGRFEVKREQFMSKRDRWRVRVGEAHYKFDSQTDAGLFHSGLMKHRNAVLKQKPAELSPAQMKIINEHAAERGVSAQKLLNAAVKTKPVGPEAPLTEAERIEMGMIRDPFVAITSSGMKTRVSVETLKASRRLAEEFAVEVPADVAAGGEKAIEAWAKQNRLVQVANKPRDIGMLAGKWVPKHVGREVAELTKVPELAERIWNNYLGAWKSAYTIWSPPTHSRNFLGNVIFSDFAGCPIYDPRNGKYYLAALKEIWTKGKAWRQLIKNGKIGTEWYGNEIKPALDNMYKGMPADLAVLEMLKKVHRTAGKMYNAGDQIYKIATYLRYVDRGRGLILKRPMKPSEAMVELDFWYPNYKNLWRPTKFLSKYPLAGPFVAFNEQALRIAGRAAVRHPIKIAKWAAMPGAISYASAWWLGLSPDELGMVNDRRSYFEPIMPWFNKDGTVATWDIRYLFPLANELEAMYNLVTGSKKRIDVPFMLDQPIVSTVTDLSYNEDKFTGRQIWKPNDSPFTKLKKGVLHSLKKDVPYPRSFTYGLDRLHNAITGESDEHVVQAIGAALFGINVKRAYVNRKDAFERVKAEAMKDPAVKDAMDKLLGGDINKWDYQKLEDDLKTNERFQSLLDLYNDTYRIIKYPGEPDRPGQKEITPRGVVQSIRAKEAKPDESVERVGLRKRFRDRLGELRKRVKDKKKENPLDTDEKREWRRLERMAARVAAVEAKIKRGKGKDSGERMYQTRQEHIDQYMRRGLGEE